MINPTPSSQMMALNRGRIKSCRFEAYREKGQTGNGYSDSVDYLVPSAEAQWAERDDMTECWETFDWRVWAPDQMG